MRKRQLCIVIFFIFFFSLSTVLLQAQENSYRYWRQEGISRYQANDFASAINAFRLAERMPEAPQINDIYDWIARSFEGRVEVMDSLRRVAETLAKASELAGSAYKQAKLNPTHGLRIAEAAVGFQSGSRSALQQLHDIISSPYPPFYATKLTHDEYVTGVAMSPDEQRIATACWDGIVRIWAVDGRLIRELKGHHEPVSEVIFSPDGQWILSGSFDNTAILWTVEGDSVQTLSGHSGDISALAFSPDSRQIATASWDGQAMIWTVGGSLLRRIKAHDDYLSSIAFSPDGGLVATGSWDKTAKVWSADGQQLSIIEGHRAAISSLAFSPNGQHLLTGSWDHNLKLWDLEGNLKQEFQGHEKGVLSVAFSPDGQYILSGGDDNVTILWNLTGSKLQTYRGHNQSVAKARFSPAGTFILSASMDFTARSWYFPGPLKKEIYSDDFGEIFSIHLMPEGKGFLIGTAGGSFLLDASGKINRHLADSRGDVNCVSASLDGSRLLTGGKGNRVLLYDRTGELLDSIRILKGAGTFSVAFSPDNRLIAFGGRNQVASVYNIRGDTLAKLVTLSGHRGAVSGIAFSPDSKRVLTSSWDKTARLWDLQGNQLAIFDGHTTRLSCIAFSPDGQSFLTGSYDYTAKLWGLEGDQLASYIGHSGHINSISFSSDGQQVLTTSHDGKIKVWNLEGQEIQTLIGHKGPVYDAAVSPDGNTIISVGSDGTVRIWLTSGAYLESDKVALLTEREQYEYGIIDSFSGMDEERIGPTKTIPYHAEFHIQEQFKVIQASDNLNYHNYVSFNLSSKAFAASDVTEKLTIQQQGLDNTFYALLEFYQGKLPPKLNLRAQVYVFT